MELSQRGKQAVNAYMQEWRKRNADKVREYNRRYWEKKAAEAEAKKAAANG